MAFYFFLFLLTMTSRQNKSMEFFSIRCSQVSYEGDYFKSAADHAVIHVVFLFPFML